MPRLAPSDIAAVPEPVSACPNCASLAIGMATPNDGVFAGGGELMQSSCPDCGYVGQPIVFRRRGDFAKFHDELLGSP